MTIFDTYTDDVDTVLLACIAAFLILLAGMMLQHMDKPDALTIALALSFLFLAIGRLFFVAERIMDDPFGRYRDEVLTSIRLVLIGLLVWATLLLVRFARYGDGHE